LGCFLEVGHQDKATPNKVYNLLQTMFSDWTIVEGKMFANEGIEITKIALVFVNLSSNLESIEIKEV